MFQFRSRQQTFDIAGVKIGGSPGENSTVLIARANSLLNQRYLSRARGLAEEYLLQHFNRVFSFIVQRDQAYFFR